MDVGALAELAGAVTVIHDRLRDGTAAVPATMHDAPARSAAAPLLLLATVARDRSLAELAALGALTGLVAESYAATESRIAQLVGTGAVGGLRTLLDAIDPGSLEQLLITSPALAGVVVASQGDVRATPGDEQRLADELTRTLFLPPALAAGVQARLFSAMGERRSRVFALLHPGLTTAMTAAPPSDRFAASRVLVCADLAALLRARVGSRPGRQQAALDERIAARQSLLTGQVVLRHPDGTTTRHPHQLLSFDPAGDGRLVEVLGDLGRAQHLAVFVPGTGSDLARYSSSFDRMLPFARADPSLAVVLWQNADHPDQPFDDPPVLAVPHLGQLPDQLVRYVREHVFAAALRDSADVAGPVLAADVAGLRVAAPVAAADLTVLGHSYGGSIVGSAEAHGMVADRVVHVASAGAYVGDARGYTSGSAQRFSMTAYDDPIQLSQGQDAADARDGVASMLPDPLDPLAPVVRAIAGLAVGDTSSVGHGLDPDLIPGVVRLDTGVDADGRLVRGHSGMFEPDSTAWRNLLGVMTRGRVDVLQPQLWSGHLDPLGVAVELPGGAVAGGTTMRPLWPRYVVDRSPYDDPAYRPPVLDLGS